MHGNGPERSVIWSVALVVAILVAGSCDWGASPVGPDAGLDADGGDGEETTDPRPPKEVGESCDGPGRCVDGALCIGNPNDVDIYTCMETCDEPWGLCDDGSVCTPVGDGSSVCYIAGASEEGRSCKTNLQCDEGLLCVGVEQNGYHCLPACHAEQGGCETSEYCQPLSPEPKGYCRSKVGPLCRGQDGTCPKGLVCSSNVAGPVASRFPDGYCTKRCDANGDCPEGSTCRTYPDTDIDLCLATCDYDADCGLTDTYRCLEERDCANEPGHNSCDAFRDGSDLCVPPDLQTWEK